MKVHETQSNATGQFVQLQSHPATFAKVVDGRKQPIRGLWIRNGRYCARLAVADGNTSLKAVRRVPLLDPDGEPVQSVAQAIAASERLRTQRASDTLPQLGQTPLFSDYAASYHQPGVRHVIQPVVEARQRFVDYHNQIVDRRAADLRDVTGFAAC